MGLRLRGVAVNLVADQSQLQRLAAEMRRFAEVSGREMSDVLAYEAKEIGWGLYNECKKLAPSPQKILTEAKARSWRMGRRGDALVQARYGISIAANRRAENLLDGEKSDFFKVTTTGEGVLQIRRVRFAARRPSKKRTRLTRVLKGGRFGNKFSAGALRASQVSRFELGQAIRTNPEIKKLNLGSVSAAVEVGLRQRAAKGATISVQWLPRVWKRSKSRTVKTGPLIVNSRSGFEMGRVTFDSRGDQLRAVTIAGNVPGTAKVLSRHNVLDKVFAGRIADRQKRISEKLSGAKGKAFRK